MSQAIIGIVSDLVRADHLVKRLFQSGFANGSISMFGPDGPLSHIRCEKHSKASEGAIMGATTGGGVGGTLGLLVNYTHVNMPMASSLIAMSPVIPVLCGIAIGTIAGILIGGLIGLFLPKYEVKQFAGLLSGGNVLVSVQVENKEQLKLVKEFFEYERVQDIHCVKERLSPEKSQIEKQTSGECWQR